MRPFPSPTADAGDRRDVLLGYLDYFRSVVLDRLGALGDDEARRTRVPSGWSPAELAHHLLHVERRWLEWGFEGRAVDDPWADDREVDGEARWHLGESVGVIELCAALAARGETTRAIVTRHDLDETGPRVRGGRAGRRPRWSGSCCTFCRSTPVIAGTSTSWSSSPGAPPASDPRCRPAIRDLVAGMLGAPFAIAGGAAFL